MNSDKALCAKSTPQVEHTMRWKSWVQWCEVGEGQAWVLLIVRTLPKISQQHWWGVTAQLLLALSARLMRTGVMSTSWSPPHRCQLAAETESQSSEALGATVPDYPLISISHSVLESLIISLQPDLFSKKNKLACLISIVLQQAGVLSNRWMASALEADPTSPGEPQYTVMPEPGNKAKGPLYSSPLLIIPPYQSMPNSSSTNIFFKVKNTNELSTHSAFTCWMPSAPKVYTVKLGHFQDDGKMTNLLMIQESITTLFTPW